MDGRVEIKTEGSYLVSKLDFPDQGMKYILNQYPNRFIVGFINFFLMDFTHRMLNNGI